MNTYDDQADKSIDAGADTGKVIADYEKYLRYLWHLNVQNTDSVVICESCNAIEQLTNELRLNRPSSSAVAVARRKIEVLAE